MTSTASIPCRSALSLLDPTAVERALQGYAFAIKTQTPTDRSTEVADALVAIALN
jgi:hypothetical protein